MQKLQKLSFEGEMYLSHAIKTYLQGRAEPEEICYMLVSILLYLCQNLGARS